jgi:hypothetical protein
MSLRVSIFAICLLPLVVCLQGCADTDPEEPGIEKPVNKRNDERGTQGDWRHAKPAVGPAE